MPTSAHFCCCALDALYAEKRYLELLHVIDVAIDTNRDVRCVDWCIAVGVHDGCVPVLYKLVRNTLKFQTCGKVPSSRERDTAFFYAMLLLARVAQDVAIAQYDLGKSGLEYVYPAFRDKVWSWMKPWLPLHETTESSFAASKLGLKSAAPTLGSVPLPSSSSSVASGTASMPAFPPSTVVPTVVYETGQPVKGAFGTVGGGGGGGGDDVGRNLRRCPLPSLLTSSVKRRLRHWFMTRGMIIADMYCEEERVTAPTKTLVLGVAESDEDEMESGGYRVTHHEYGNGESDDNDTDVDNMYDDSHVEDDRGSGAFCADPRARTKAAIFQRHNGHCMRRPIYPCPAWVTSFSITCLQTFTFSQPAALSQAACSRSMTSRHTRAVVAGHFLGALESSRTWHDFMQISMVIPREDFVCVKHA
jgi:hypothetical protein